MLIEIEAVPAYQPSWSKGLSLQECQAWAPEPPTAEQLDHLFVTRLGMLDIPPALTGTYAELQPSADSVQLAGAPVRVCAPEEVLSRLPARPRAKDIERAVHYAAVREALRRGRVPRAVAWFDHRIS
ncbi:hypothetical protein [Amycolatopsis taiwanensis]|uniref:Uncharacterized protein n=1 Tax=Amycolatopsis taiwanensis TaxID=342230 RepID=A0A9W6QYF1_9PSEU|nr:hypothetical protein [Amycolatopsis taiwanensis]GLY65145.1 hypothetical protein Atai01_17640 [Amycolatopsis taiwanensis]